jgi:hypothetical protein
MQGKEQTAKQQFFNALRANNEQVALDILNNALMDDKKEIIQDATNPAYPAGGALRTASRYGFTKTVQTLIELYKEVYVGDTYKQKLQEAMTEGQSANTPIALASYHGHVGTVQALIDIYKEEYVDDKENLRNGLEVSIRWPSFHKHIGTAKLLLAHASYLPNRDTLLDKMLGKCLKKMDIFGTEDNDEIKKQILDNREEIIINAKYLEHGMSINAVRSLAKFKDGFTPPFNHTPAVQDMFRTAKNIFSEKFFKSNSASPISILPIELRIKILSYAAGRDMTTPDNSRALRIFQERLGKALNNQTNVPLTTSSVVERIIAEKATKAEGAPSLG